MEQNRKHFQDVFLQAVESETRSDEKGRSKRMNHKLHGDIRTGSFCGTYSGRGVWGGANISLAPHLHPNYSMRLVSSWGVLDDRAPKQRFDGLE